MNFYECCDLAKKGYPATIFAEILNFFLNFRCGHCKSMKGDYSGAAKRLAQDNSKAVLAAVDATVEQSLGNVYNIKGYPTLKYFYKGKCSSN